jgi:hypothetical protein
MRGNIDLRRKRLGNCRYWIGIQEAKVLLNLNYSYSRGSELPNEGQYVPVRVNDCQCALSQCKIGAYPVYYISPMYGHILPLC